MDAGTVVERIDALGFGLGVAVDSQGHASGVGGLVAKGIHFPEFPHRVDVKQRKRRHGREEGLARKVQQDSRVLAGREQQHRPFAPGRHLPENVYGLGLKRAKDVVVQPHDLAVARESRGANPHAGMTAVVSISIRATSSISPLTSTTAMAG